MRLAEPGRLSHSKDIYMVPMNTEQNGTKNIGQLKVQEVYFPARLKAVENSYPIKPVSFFLLLKTTQVLNIQKPGCAKNRKFLITDTDTFLVTENFISVNKNNSTAEKCTYLNTFKKENYETQY